jgi:hypothetical protein
MRPLLKVVALSPSNTSSRRISIGEEAGHRRVFVWALEWPGWCRSGRDALSAVDALESARSRYAIVAKAAGAEFPAEEEGFVTVARVQGGGGTDFGVPSVITDHDRKAVTPATAARLGSLVAACWSLFDEVAEAAPENLTKGPRGGGRDTSKIVAHVAEAEDAYAREIGIKLKAPMDIGRVRTAILEVLRRPSDGSPLAGRKWPQRYAARRVAWHVLDHTWEIEDRTPG